jgi:hypothetical protein
MGIKDQRIEIGFSIKTITRCVYDIQDNEALKFQTGYVQYDNNEIPVWRKYDPLNISLSAPWRKGKWENIYVLRMEHKQGERYVRYETTEISCQGVSIPAPKVSIELMAAFKTHINSASGNGFSASTPSAAASQGKRS